MVSYLFAPVASHVALVVSKALLFRLLFLNFLFHLDSFLRPEGRGLNGGNLLLKVGGLSPAIDIRTGNLIGMNGGSVGLPRDKVVAVDCHHPRFALDLLHDLLEDAVFLFRGELVVLSHIIYYRY